MLSVFLQLSTQTRTITPTSYYRQNFSAFLVAIFIFAFNFTFDSRNKFMFTHNLRLTELKKVLNANQ